ncbi:uncharacterized protein LOC141810914 [Halichoeres trimaculatus]|uniref:uncharacterized protein LOC141810914 n=1 Tax=Halichoeres trimaculatus TaxID=147232 RepID=UPI003D9ECBBB
MSAVERRGAPETRPSRNLDLQHHRPRPPLVRSTWRPHGPRSAQHALHRGLVYVSFVSKAVLWDRGVCSHTAHDHHHHPHHHPSLCPRFLSHMKSHPEDLRPPHFLSSRSKPPPPLSALKTHTPEGGFTLGLERKRNVQNHVTGRRSAVIVPCPPLPAPPPSSTVNPIPPHLNPPHTSGTSSPASQPASPPFSHPASEEEDENIKTGDPALVSISDSDVKQEFDPAELDQSSPPASAASHSSPSDFTRPPSSLFSRSTDFASGRSSVLLDEGGSVFLSPLRPRSVMLSPSASNTPSTTNPNQTTLTPAAATPFCEGGFRPEYALSPRPTSGVLHQSDRAQRRRERAEMTEVYPRASSTDPVVNAHTDSNPGLFASAFHSATWSSCPTPPRSGSGPKLSPSTSLSRLESHHWPVLPPISPSRGCCGTAGSRYSELSCSQSHVFDELEAIAPRSTSCPSLDQTYDSSSSSSPDTDLSPGLAALTVGCDSGKLGSISRVQLLLLDRNDPETTLSPFGYDDDLLGEEDWSDLRAQDDAELTSAGVSRPLTAGSGSERCDSAGKVQENKSDDSDGDTGSPSSWIVDQSPSYDMFRSADPPLTSCDP